MTHARLRLPIVFGTILSILTVATFGCSSGGESNPDAPDGWKKFNEGAWSGYVAPDWSVTRVDSEKVLSAADLADLPGLSQASIDEMFSSGGLSEVLFVFLDENSTFAKNINLIGCFSNAESGPQGREVESYQSGGIRATVNSRATFEGKELNLIQAFLLSTNDTYQVFPRDGDCNMVITLSTRPGDTSSLEDFKTFLKLIEVDAEELGK